MIDNTELEAVLEVQRFDEELTADNVLKYAEGIGLERVIVIGVREDGEHYYASNDHDGTWVYFELDRFKEFLMRDMY